MIDKRFVHRNAYRVIDKRKASPGESGSECITIHHPHKRLPRRLARMIYGDGDVSRLINVPLRRCAPGKPTSKMSAGRMSLYSLTSLIYATGGKPGRAIHYVYVSQKIRTYCRAWVVVRRQ